ncbi:hypothetical protein DSL72_006842 [Monilinia vaccinii-corymbosi]|uniref:Uncharacterized protein n=1 Tax=Monilinia vaccinii-corymbosi TaxID=61207 RepID=A0A8A3PKT4_9HELO|nr:hypothetical protein DSL72_006842 [Monilinia vaccinii-corymbosi]
MNSARNPVNANANTNVRNQSRSRSRERNQRAQGRGRGNANRNANRNKQRSDARSADNITDRDSDSGTDARSESEIERTRRRICRINVCAQLANGIVQPSMLNAEIHPKVGMDGNYPRAFNIPKKVREFMDMDAHTLDKILSAYRLPHFDNRKRSPHVAIRRHAMIDPVDLAGLSLNDPRLAAFTHCPNAHHHRIYPCKNCDVHGRQADEATNDVKREILFEKLSVGAVWLNLWGENGGAGQQGGALVAGGYGNASGNGNGSRNGNGNGNGGNGTAAGGGSVVVGGAATGGRRPLILNQGAQGVHGVQIQGTGAHGVIPNRLNNNNIGLAHPGHHNDNGNGNGSGGSRLLGRRRDS